MVTEAKIISADDHMDLNELPKDLWEKRLPASFRDVAPRVAVDPERGPIWTGDGQRWGPHGPGRPGSMPSLFEKAGFDGDWTVRPSNPQLRMEDMDRDGVYAQIIYPGLKGIPASSPELKYECIKAYNDWTAEFDGASGGRLHSLAVLPSHEPEAAVLELERTGNLGHKGAIFDHNDEKHPIFDPVWEPLWAAAEERGMPISVHLAQAGTHMLRSRPSSWMMGAYVSVSAIQLDEVLSSLCFCGALERHPGLKVMLGESGLWWIPHLVRVMDRVFNNYRGTFKDFRPEVPPSELFRRQVYSTYLGDPESIRLMAEFAPGNIMWSSDYPHPGSSWPRSQEEIAEAHAGLEPRVVDKVTRENVSKLYGIQPGQSSAHRR